MGYDLVGYIQKKSSDGTWKMFPLKYEDKYIEFNWCGWDCPMSKVVKDICYAITVKEGEEITKAVFGESDENEISCWYAVSFPYLKMTMYEAKEAERKMAVREYNEYNEDDDYSTIDEEKDKYEYLKELIDKIEMIIDLTDESYINKDDIRIIFYESY